LPLIKRLPHKFYFYLLLTGSYNILQTFRALFPLAGNASQEGAVLLASCLQPRSRGTVRIKDTYPLTVPIIDPRYLTDPADLVCMSQGSALINYYNK
jgi:choline dehydrogenase-like flavoprotein